MKKLAVLGPEGTYCDVAAKLLLQNLEETYELIYYPSILKTAMAISDEVDALLPFENTLDGFVLETMDAIIKNNTTILRQLKLPISFSFVSNAKRIEDITDVFVQFKAHGQCLDFLGGHNFKIHVTQSNIESLNELKQACNNFGAIIPSHVECSDFSLVMKNVADSLANETRFVHVSKKNNDVPSKRNGSASVVITSLEDRPGILFGLLERFNTYHINLKAILSRPRKDLMGKYIFYLEFEFEHRELEKIQILLQEIEKETDTKVQILGIYNTI